MKALFGWECAAWHKFFNPRNFPKLVLYHSFARATVDPRFGAVKLNKLALLRRLQCVPASWKADNRGGIPEAPREATERPWPRDAACYSDKILVFRALRGHWMASNSSIPISMASSTANPVALRQPEHSASFSPEVRHSGSIVERDHNLALWNMSARQVSRLVPRRR